jgi:hypothetical protein
MKWKKKTKSQLPEDKTCRNCGTQTTGRYCHECGQDLLAGIGKPILKLIAPMLDNIFALDGKTPRTLFYLVFHPGFLSEEYMKGRINRYVLPVKLFWMSTIIFFALLISQVDWNNWQKNQNKEKSTTTITIAGKKIVDESHSDTVEDGHETTIDIEPEIEKKALFTSEEFVSILFKNFSRFAPYVSFLLIPIFALLLVVFFWRKKYYYVHHLMFTVHFHTFLWVFCSLLAIANLFVSSKFPGWLVNILFFIPGIYFVFALHRFYHSEDHRIYSWWQTIWKSILIAVFYFFIITIVVILLLILLLLVLYPELFK